jgi:hypothetical protein
MDVSVDGLEATRECQGIAAFRERMRIGSFQRFRRWCAVRCLQSLPSKSATVARFALELSSEIGTEELRSLLRAVRRTHLVLGFADPTRGALDGGADCGTARSRKRLERPLPQLAANESPPEGEEDA